METRIKILLDSNPLYKEYIRNNSYWYKILYRNPELIREFIEEVKDKYKLRFTDKVNNLDITKKLEVIKEEIRNDEVAKKLIKKFNNAKEL